MEWLSGDGRRSLVELGFPGDLLGLYQGQTAKYALEAATDSEICRFEPGAFPRLMRRDPVFRRAVAAALGAQLERQRAILLLLGALTSRERIDSFLVIATRTMAVEPQPDGSTVVTIPIGRQDWADLCNVSVESISRRMTELVMSELVTAVAPNRFRIRDLDALIALTGLRAEDLRSIGPRKPLVPSAVSVRERRSRVEARPDPTADPAEPPPRETDRKPG